MEWDNPVGSSQRPIMDWFRLNPCDRSRPDATDTSRGRSVRSASTCLLGEVPLATPPHLLAPPLLPVPRRASIFHTEKPLRQEKNRPYFQPASQRGRSS